jgi:hypothetical protein
MANDIERIDTGAAIKNGTAIVGCLPTGPTSSLKNNDHVSNKPVIADIQAKYDARFDEPRYYTGDSATDS